MELTVPWAIYAGVMAGAPTVCGVLLSRAAWRIEEPSDVVRAGHPIARRLWGALVPIITTIALAYVAGWACLIGRPDIGRVLAVPVVPLAGVALVTIATGRPTALVLPSMRPRREGRS